MGTESFIKVFYTAVRNHVARERDRREGEEGTWCLKEMSELREVTKKATLKGFVPASRAPRQS